MNQPTLDITRESVPFLYLLTKPSSDGHPLAAFPKKNLKCTAQLQQCVQCAVPLASKA